MIEHIIQKKRVIVMDCDITIGEDDWKKIMRHILGRHFVDLRGQGPGWSFSQTHLETFLSMVEKHVASLSDQKETTCICSEDEKSSTQKSTDEEEKLSSDEKSVEPETSSTLCSSTDKETTSETSLEEEQQSFSSSDDKSVQNSETQTDEDDVNNNFVDIEQTNFQSFQNSQTQTCSKIFFETKQHGKHVYKFDVDDQIRFFVDHWTQKAKFLV